MSAVILQHSVSSICGVLSNMPTDNGQLGPCGTSQFARRTRVAAIKCQPNKRVTAAAVYSSAGETHHTRLADQSSLQGGAAVSSTFLCPASRRGIDLQLSFHPAAQVLVCAVQDWLWVLHSCSMPLWQYESEAVKQPTVHCAHVNA